MRCWSCSKGSGGTFFCNTCDVIQPPKKEKNYFELFESPITFDLDTSYLTKMYRNLQRKVHPDSFELKSEKERLYSSEQSSLINHAYKTLMRPLTRALYLLALAGHTVEEDARVEDVELLSHIMETREQVEEANPEEAKELWNENRRVKLECMANISRTLKEKNYEEAKDEITKLQYLQRIEDTIEDKFGLMD